jgi:hypothetical protein
MMTSNDDKQKIGEALGLEMAAQKGVEELVSKGLLDKGGMKKDKLEGEKNRPIIIKQILKNYSITITGIRFYQYTRSSKWNRKENIWNDEDISWWNPDASEAIEFFCLTEGEVTHYEVLGAMTKKLVKDRKFSAKVKAILEEEKKHLQLCTRLAKQIAVE